VLKPKRHVHELADLVEGVAAAEAIRAALSTVGPLD